ncbi:MAG: VanW family protein [Bacilli bacterium]
MKRNSKRLIFCISGFLLICGSGSYVFATQTDKKLETYILPNTIVEDMKLDGLTFQEAQTKIAEKTAEFNNTKLKLVYGNTIYEIPLSELGVTFNDKDLLSKIKNNQTSGNFFDRLDRKQRADEGDRTVEERIQLSVSETNIANYLKKKIKRTLKTPVDASYRFTNNTFTVNPSKTGLAVDIPTLTHTIAEQITAKNIKPITMPTTTLTPKVSTAALESAQLDKTIASYKTPFKSAKESVFNAKVAANLLNGAIIAPGENFSFMNRIGRITKEAGYINSRTFVAGKESIGIGGGVCQVSSTLYYTALLANLDVTNRASHSRPVSYIPIGLDAAVANDGPDLKFTNNTAHHIAITAFAKDNHLVIQIHGKPNGKKVTLQSKVEKKTDTQIFASATKTVTVTGKSTTTALRNSTYRID